ncbi:MAG: DUF3362 domain-containing protein, partial [Paraclostridium sp.]
EYLRDTKYQPEQVQDFYPTPGTLSTTMFYTGIDPLTMKPVYTPKSKQEKAMQRALLQYRAPRNYDLVHAALVEAGREDLIGFGPRCLIKPKGEYPRNNHYGNKNKSASNKSSRGNKKEDTRGKRGNKGSRDNNSRNEKNNRNNNASKPKRKKR